VIFGWIALSPENLFVETFLIGEVGSALGGFAVFVMIVKVLELMLADGLFPVSESNQLARLQVSHGRL